MMVIPFVVFIVSALRVFALLRSGLNPDRQDMKSGTQPKRSRFDPKPASRVAGFQLIARSASLMTLAIAMACLLTGLFILVPNPNASSIPTTDNPSLMLVTALCGFLTVATWADALLIAAFLVTVRTIARSIEAALALFGGPSRQTWRQATLKPPRISSASGCVVDDWLDNP